MMLGLYVRDVEVARSNRVAPIGGRLVNPRVLFSWFSRIAQFTRLTRRNLSFTIGGMEMAAVEITNLRSNLKALCDRHGEIQRVANAAKVSRVFLSNFLHGKSSLSLETALDIANAVGVPLPTLMDDPKNIMSRAS